ncbi:MAG: UDP-N-acetylmuramoyl-tripeptide--D-alanyl-D-alanine ligase [Chitinophagaceae bacterium]|jgi:UDP-N-acetylmuramoyl-tripeptide--D-alanyl-D-alanine ligase|nr:UDP-N-acetylmuramoyl-tripeptide--D-alanyl-D-alanine ligase [Chitinophagaceae bacterium]OQY96319.1 MAG: UDP-N-acetylmuramoylalanyl-D-glutamate--2,6-diaminopimelate ligase [Sphingobacteriales bacterium UTBCD1]
MRIEELYKIYLQNPSIQTDSRKLRPGDIFFALKGDNFNGNKFAKQAIDSGAAYAVIDEKEFEIPGKTMLVENVLTSLQQLAKHHRLQFSIPFFAITGSNGKTTTKELIHAVLSTTYKTYTTEGNLNNHIGIPLTLLKIRSDAEVAIVEMGANHIGEIASYCRIVLPTHGLITNCGKAHLEGFGSEEGVRKGKGELYDYLKANSGTAFVMWDYDYLREMSKGIAVINTYGTHDSEIVGDIIASDPFLQVKFKKGTTITEIQTHLVGGYNLPNVLAAVAAGKYFKVTDEKIKNTIGNYIPSNNRSQWIRIGTNDIILDAYNANPSSMKQAIDNFSKMHAPNKILVLGSMAELGNDSIKEHKSLLELIKRTGWKNVILVGANFEAISSNYNWFADSANAGEWIKEQNFQNCTFLVKGSRSMQMEKAIRN